MMEVGSVRRHGVVVGGAILTVVLSACMPTGAIDRVVSDFDTSVGSGDITVTGWASDLDADGPIPVHVVLDGDRTIEGAAEELLAPSSVTPGPLVNVGPRAFTIKIPAVGPGEHELCARIENSGRSAADADLGCRRVVVGELQADLFEARRVWRSAGLDRYAFTYENDCFCPAEGRGPFRVEVSGDTARATVVGSTVEAPADAALTVDDLFDLVQESIDRPASSVRVDYDPSTGAPRSILIDWVADAVDEETSLRISAIEERVHPG